MGFATILGVIILGAVLAYGAFRAGKRNRRHDPQLNASVKNEYRDPGSNPPPR